MPKQPLDLNREQQDLSALASEMRKGPSGGLSTTAFLMKAMLYSAHDIATPEKIGISQQIISERRFAQMELLATRHQSEITPTLAKIATNVDAIANRKTPETRALHNQYMEELNKYKNETNDLTSQLEKLSGDFIKGCKERLAILRKINTDKKSLQQNSVGKKTPQQIQEITKMAEKAITNLEALRLQLESTFEKEKSLQKKLDRLYEKSFNDANVTGTMRFQPTQRRIP